MSDKMQDEFEEWAVSKGWCVNKTNDIYDNTYVGAAYEAWQASRQALVVQLPDICDLHPRKMLESEVIKKIESAGIKWTE